MYLVVNKCVTAVKVQTSLAIISVTVQLWISVFWVISVYFNLRNTFPKFGTFLLGHPVYIYIYTHTISRALRIPTESGFVSPFEDRKFNKLNDVFCSIFHHIRNRKLYSNVPRFCPFVVLMAVAIR